GLVPVRLNRSGQDVLAPIVLGNEELAAIGIEYPDHVRIVRRILGRRLPCGSAGAEKLFKKTHELEMRCASTTESGSDLAAWLVKRPVAGHRRCSKHARYQREGGRGQRTEVGGWKFSGRRARG